MLGVITVFAIIFLTGGATDDKEKFRETFQVDAIYYETGHVEISYNDKSEKNRIGSNGNSRHGRNFSKNIFRFSIY